MQLSKSTQKRYDTENPRICSEIRLLRNAKKLTLRQLATRCGRTPGYLSQVENGAVTPSIETLNRIAEALGVEVSWFFPTKTGTSDTEASIVVRSQSRRRISHSYSYDAKQLGYQDFLLSPNLGLDLTMGLSRFEPGGRTRGVPTQSHGHICGFVLRGRIRIDVEEDEFFLSPEDSFAFDLKLKHDFVNDHADTSELIWAISPTHLDF